MTPRLMDRFEVHQSDRRQHEMQCKHKSICKNSEGRGELMHTSADVHIKKQFFSDKQRKRSAAWLMANVKYRRQISNSFVSRMAKTIKQKEKGNSILVSRYDKFITTIETPYVVRRKKINLVFFSLQEKKSGCFLKFCFSWYHNNECSCGELYK